MASYEFTSLLQTVWSECLAGFGDNGRPLLRAEAQMEGSLRSFQGFGDVDRRLVRSPPPATSVSVSVEFTAENGRPDLYEYGEDGTESGYIGQIQFWDRNSAGQSFSLENHKKGVEFKANIELTLPLHVQQHLNVAGRDPVLFTAMCDSIDEPDEIQKGDHIVALVKRVSFRSPDAEASSPLDEPTTGETSSIEETRNVGTKGQGESIERFERVSAKVS